MATERTFAMIKPDAIRAHHTGSIITMIERAGFEIVHMHKTHLTPAIVKEFYVIHKDRPFFDEMVDFVTSGPVVIMALEKEGAIKAWRDLMGATNPDEADEGTVRKLYGASIGSNAAHGSDAPETATQELMLFFNE